jgi:cell volume regulation protein A
LVARPFSVFACLDFFNIQNRSKWFISWVGLRGSVPIVFATYPLIAGAVKADMIFNIVFFISLTSVLVQGTTLPYMAKLLHLTLPEKVKQRTKTNIEISNDMKSLLTEIKIPIGNKIIDKPLVELGFPKTALIVLIQRTGKFIVPDGSSRLQTEDIIYVISENKKDMVKVFECLKISNLEA